MTSVNSLGQLPFHPIPNVPNFRTIGGWPISSSQPKHVKPYLVYRGADPLRITTPGIEALLNLNIKTYFDLRSKQQVEKLGVRDLSEHGIERRWTPVFGEGEYTEEKAGERYARYASEDVGDIVEAFIEILIAGAPMLSNVLRHLISTTRSHEKQEDKQPPPALCLHCTTGNNRTGVFVALLLLLLHVPDEYVVYEYTLSEVGLAPTRHLNIERLLKKGAFADLGPEEARRKCKRMVGARAESMEALIGEVQQKWGGAEGYFRDVIRLSEEEIEEVRKILSADGEGEMANVLSKNGIAS